MRNLLSVEGIKIKKSLVLKIVFFILIGLAVMNVAVYGLVYYLQTSQILGEVDISVGNLGPQFTVTGMLGSTLASDTNCIACVAVLLAIIVCSEFSSRTLQNSLMAGNSRMKVAYTKLLIAVIIYVICAILYIGIIVGGCAIFMPLGENVNVGGDILKVVLFIVANLGNIALLWMIMFKTKSTGVALGISLPLTILISPIVMLLTGYSDIAKAILQWVPFISIGPNFMEAMDAMNIVRILVVSGVSIVLSIVITRLTFPKADLK